MRIRISKRSSELVDQLTHLFNFRHYSIVVRIAFAYSLQLNKRAHPEEETGVADGKEWRDERPLFGASTDERSHVVIYRALLDQYYKRNIPEDEFIKLFKLHLDFGLESMYNELDAQSPTKDGHLHYLLAMIQKGLSRITPAHSLLKGGGTAAYDMQSCPKLITLTLGRDEQGKEIVFPINDLNEFDSCNIAIAGMTGSGKTELVKDLLYQVSRQSDNTIRFIFFDHKGKGNTDELTPFFEQTSCRMADLNRGPIELNPLSFINQRGERGRELAIVSFTEFFSTAGIPLEQGQKNTLATVIAQCFDGFSTLSAALPANYEQSCPTLNDVFTELQEYYQRNVIPPDPLYAVMETLARNIFTAARETPTPRIFEQNLYVNLPVAGPDVLKQLCVYMTLNYLLAEFSVMSDTLPSEGRIKPLRYVIVIDEAYVYLNNQSGCKALENILRILRSKGVVVIMLTQGLEDYKTKNFDFVSQVKIPICLNVHNKDYKLIESFIGTPRSKQKLQAVIAQLDVQKAIINIPEPQVIRVNQFWERQL